MSASDPCRLRRASSDLTPGRVAPTAPRFPPTDANMEPGGAVLTHCNARGQMGKDGSPLRNQT
jgi:hypothetical protein